VTSLYVGVSSQCDKPLVRGGVIAYSQASGRKLAGSHNGQAGQCIATPAFNGKLLYFGGNETTVNGVTYLGSVQAREPDSGALVWETPLADGVTGSPSIDGGGVLAVPAYYAPTGSTPDAVYLVDPGSGRILRVLAHGTEFAQAVFAGGWMFSADSDGVYAWKLKR
jgi:outer membrane protein assembly factor BamB